MSRPRFLIRVASLFMIAGAAIPASAAIIEVSDSEFADGSWTSITSFANNGASHSEGQTSFSGSLAREMTHTMPAAVMPGGGTNDTIVVVAHEFLDFVYDPAVSGEILSVDYSERAAHPNPPFPGAEMFWAPALFQDGIAYHVFRASFSGTTLQTLGYTGLGATSFISVDDLTLIGGSGAHSTPDFTASGSPITFGYLRASSYTQFFGTEIRQHIIDDWMYTLHTADVPEPMGAALFGLALGALVWRLRF